VTLEGQTRDPNTLRAQYLENYLSYRDFKFGMQLCMGNAERQTFTLQMKCMMYALCILHGSSLERLDGI